MRQLMLILGASWISVKFLSKNDVQWEALNQSRDLIESATKAKLARREYPNQNQKNRQWENVKTSEINFQPCIVTICRDLDLYIHTLCLIFSSICLNPQRNSTYQHLRVFSHLLSEETETGTQTFDSSSEITELRSSQESEMEPVFSETPDIEFILRSVD